VPSLPLAAAVVAAASVAVAAPAAAAPLRIAAKPKLQPSFRPSVTDYVSRCHPGKPLRLAIRAPRPGVRINGGRAVRGRFRVRMDMRSGEGVRVATRGRTYMIRCVADDFPRWTTERHGTPQARYYIVTPTLGPHGSRYVAVVDTHGVPVWWMRRKTKPHDAKLLPDGNIAWGTFINQAYAAFNVPYEEHRLDGSFVRRYAARGVATDSHDLEFLPNGNRLQESYVPRDGVDLSRYGGPKRATVTDAEVQELTPRNKVVFRWNSRGHVALDEAQRLMQSIIDGPIDTTDGRHAYDIVHINSVAPYGRDAILISMRQTDALYKISVKTGAIEWKLGGTHTPESLTVTGDDGDPLLLGGQHDARVLPDGTITVHDNRTGTGLQPRALRFRIDDAARTATIVEDITDPATADSTCCGGARRLPGGDWVMSWGRNPIVTELTPLGRRVFGIRLPPDTTYSYRVDPVLPGRLRLRAMRRGMDAMHPPVRRPVTIRRG
jgi:hypothetical protein